MSIPSNMDPIGARAAAAGDPILANADGYIVWNGDFTEVTHAKLDTLTNASYLFYKRRDLTNINGKVSLDSAVDCNNMFYCCYKLKSANIVIPNATISYWLFCECHELEYLNDDFSMPLSTQCNSIFAHCKNLKRIPEGFSCPNADTVEQLFRDNYQITTIPKNFNCKRATNCGRMFSWCGNLTTLPEGFSLPKALYCGALFENCGKLSNLPSSFSLESAGDLNRAFQGCTSLTSEDIELIISTLPTHTSGTHPITLPNTDAAKAVDVSGLADKGWTVNYA